MKKYIAPEVKLLPLVIQDEVTNGVGGVDQYGYTGSGGIVLPEDEF